MKPLKGAKAKPTHTDLVKKGSGDFYGTGKNNPFGKVIESKLKASFPAAKKLGKPPKKLA